MVESWQFWSNLAAQVAIAIGTIGAVVVALFGNKLRATFAPPRLFLRLLDNRGTETPVILTAPDGSRRETVSRWYHLRVENGRRWSPATQVQVFLLRIEEPDAAGQYRAIWTGELPIRWRYQEIHPLVRSIGYGADVDLCSVVKEKWFQLHPVIEPIEFRDSDAEQVSLRIKRREGFNMALTLQARGLETDSNRIRVLIHWDGAWADDPEVMQRHLVVKADSSSHH